MLSDLVARRAAARGLHYGWIVAAVTFITMLATAGAMGAAGVLVQPLQAEFGWTNAEISFAFAVRLVLFGLFGPFAAALMNRFGIRRVVCSALVTVVAGILGSFAMRETWQLVALWGVVVGIGTGMTALVLGATVAARWFTARRGLVVGLMTASTATGQLVFLPLLAKLTETVGWRPALSIVVGALLVAFTLMALLMRDAPADLGLAPFGETRVRPLALQAGGLGAALLRPLQVLGEASRSGTFWVLFATFFVCGLSTNGLIQMHWLSICGDVGIAPVAAAGMLAVIGVFDLSGTILSGWLSDRFDSRRLLFWFYGLRGLSLLALPFTGFNLTALSLFAVFYGMDWVATVPPTVKLTAARFGPERAGIVFGWVFTGHQLGAATAAWGAGWSRTALDTYTPALVGAGLACLAAALVIVTLRPSNHSAGVSPAAQAA